MDYDQESTMKNLVAQQGITLLSVLTLVCMFGNQTVNQRLLQKSSQGGGKTFLYKNILTQKKSFSSKKFELTDDTSTLQSSTSGLALKQLPRSCFATDQEIENAKTIGDIKGLMQN